MNFTDSTSYKEVYIVMAPQPLYKFRSQYNIFEPLIIMDLALWDVFIYSVEQCYEDVFFEIGYALLLNHWINWVTGPF
jgi:hypothetical protein